MTDSRGPRRRSLVSYSTDPRGATAPIALTTLAAYVLLAVLAAAVIDPSLLPSAVALGALAAGLLQWALLAIAQRLALRRSWFRRHSVVSVLIVVIIVMVSGAIVMVVTSNQQGSFVASMSASESMLMWLARATILLVLTAGWSVVDDYRRGLADLRSAQQGLEVARSEGVERVVRQRADVVSQITGMLEEMLTSDDGGEARELTRLARERIRPLSHELASEFPEYEPRRPVEPAPPPWRQILDDVLHRPLISPLLMAITVTVLFISRTASPATAPPEGATSATLESGSVELSVSLDVASFLGSLGYLLVVFLATWGAGIVASRLTADRLPSLGTGGRVVLILATLVGMAVVVQLVIGLSSFVPGLGSEGQSTFARDLVVTIPIFLIAVVLLAIRVVAELFASVTRSAGAVNQDLEWEIARANDTLVQERRFLATAVHGPVQSAVAAAGLALGKAVEEGAPVDRAWAQARDRIGSIVAGLADGPPASRDLMHELREVSGTWTGVCDVRVEVDDEAAVALARDWVCAGTLSDLVTEAVANAAMHGQATTVSIVVRREIDAVLSVVITDDGTPGDEAEGKGLGSQLLDEIALSWDRRLTPEGATVEVLLPTAA